MVEFGFAGRCEATLCFCGVAIPGQFGKVWKVRHNEEVYAMKAIRKEFFDKKGMFGLLKTERGV